MSSGDIAGMDETSANDTFPHDHVSLAQSPLAREFLSEEFQVGAARAGCVGNQAIVNHDTFLSPFAVQGRMLFAIPKKGRLYDKIIALLKVTPPPLPSRPLEASGRCRALFGVISACCEHPMASGIPG